MKNVCMVEQYHTETNIQALGSVKEPIWAGIQKQFFNPDEILGSKLYLNHIKESHASVKF